MCSDSEEYRFKKHGLKRSDYIYKIVLYILIEHWHALEAGSAYSCSPIVGINITLNKRPVGLYSSAEF